MLFFLLLDKPWAYSNFFLTNLGCLQVEIFFKHILHPNISKLSFFNFEFILSSKVQQLHFNTNIGRADNLRLSCFSICPWTFYKMSVFFRHNFLRFFSFAIHFFSFLVCLYIFLLVCVSVSLSLGLSDCVLISVNLYIIQSSYCRKHWVFSIRYVTKTPLLGTW